MIRRVRIENWRAYKSFELNLGRGTTFLVAANGVGKSSFIEAVRWALSADPSPPRSAMRRGADSSTVEVEFDAGGVSVRIRRSLHQGRARAPRPSTETWIDGQLVESDLVYKLMTETWEADNDFACRAAFLTDHLLTGDEDPELRPHLAHLYSLDRLQTAVDLLVPAIRIATREADAAKHGQRESSADLRSAMDALVAAQADLDVARERSDSLREHARSASNQLKMMQDANEALEEYRRWTQRRAGIVAEAQSLIGDAVEGSDLGTILQAAEAAAEQQRLIAAEQQARLRERLATIEQLLEQLQESTGECPVCRRPLDSDARGHAEDRHRHDRSATIEAFEELDFESPNTLVQNLRSLVEQVRALGDAPQGVPETAVDLEPYALRAEEDSRAFEDALLGVGRAEAALGAATSRIDEIKENEGDDLATQLYTKLAALEASQAAFEGTITAVLDSQLGPVSDEINRRWASVFPERPGLRLTAEGDLYRTFDDDLTRDLEFDAFSSGEKVVAKLMMRLAMLRSTTEVPFCMLDEPLEHLDLDARSYVAHVLAHLSEPDSLDQILVTTYEQGLALELANAASGQVHLEFLRTAHLG
jgi:DNA repair exonuclease SbcCD ATPase subunit